MNQTEKNWDRMAKAYEDFTTGADSYSYAIEWKNIQEMLPALKDATVLDMGCGTGRFTFWLEEEKPKHIVGVDISDNMLQLAREKSDALHSNAQFFKANIAMPFTDETFDFIFSSTVTHYLQDLPNLFERIAEMLKQNGTCILSVMHPIYTAQYPIKKESFPQDDEWVVRYLDKSERSYIQPWIEYNDEIEDFLSCSYHHTVGDYINAIIGASLILEEIREPLPPTTWLETYPARYENFLETPSYMILKLKKK